MKTVDIYHLKLNAGKLISDVINNDEFFEVETEDGVAVVINEREWNVLIEALLHHNSVWFHRKKSSRNINQNHCSFLQNLIITAIL